MFGRKPKMHVWAIFGRKFRWPNIQCIRIFYHRNNILSSFIKDFYHQNNTAEMLWWRKQKPRPARACLKQHVKLTAIYKTCNAEISRGGASPKTFSMSGLIHYLKSKHPDRWIWEERGTEKENASEHARSVCGGRLWKGKEVSQWHMGYGSLCFDTLLCWRPTEKILLYL